MTGKADAVRAVSQQFKDRTNTVIEGVMAHLRDDNAKEILGPGLSPLIGRGSLKSIVTFALYADVLRMVRDMVMADGKISDEEVQESLGLLSVLAAGFAKVRKAYAAHAKLSAENTRGFLSQYEADAGLFGHANESTKWAGLAICRNIHSRCHDGRPLEVFGGALVAWAEAIAGSDEVTPFEQAALDALREHTGQALFTARPASDITQRANESEAEATREGSGQLGALLAAIDNGNTKSAGSVIELLQDAVATPQNAWSVLLYYLDWGCTQPPDPETDRVGTQTVPLRIPEWGQFAFAHDDCLADLGSEEHPEVWQRFKNYLERKGVITAQICDFEIGNWPAERLVDTLTRIYGGTARQMPVRIFFAAEADGSGIRIFTQLALGEAIAAPIRASQRWVLESLFRLAEDDSRESVTKQPITIGGLLGRKKTFGLNTPASLRPSPVVWSGETLWVAVEDSWRRLKHPLQQLNVGYLVSKDLSGSAFEECIDGAVDSLVALVDWMASAAVENEQASQQVLPWQPAILLAASASEALGDACYPAELTVDFARAERGDEAAIALLAEYLESAEDVDSDDEDDDEQPHSPIGTFADPPGTITNSIGMKLVPIPAGEFLMGSPEDCPLGDPDEEFQHRVRITKPFLIGMHQVTQAQYEHVTGDNPSFFQGPDLPVEHLAWKDAKRFCDLLSALPGERQTGRRYRLPTEAEWEYACRAGTTSPFHTGNNLELDQARFSTKYRTSPKQTSPVGSYPPNAWGFHDMHGNVWEWTSDWFSVDYFRESPVDDPQGPAIGTHHTLRGGSASVEAHECHAAVRGESAHDGPRSDEAFRYEFIGDFGMRVVCEANPKRELLGPQSLMQELKPETSPAQDGLPTNRPQQPPQNAATSSPPSPASDPANSFSSRTVRIFISSTFRDFAQERDLLVRKVFPELRRRCRERQVELVDVDLRWGITQAEAEQGKVLPICLAEIDRARPFFMGLLGERYGWVPASGQFDRSLLIEQPWLEEHAGEKSVTELEILHGVLNNPKMAGRAFFYFRDPSWSEQQGTDSGTESETECKKLVDLKDRIRSSGFPVVEDYSDPEVLAERVREDLWNLIDAAYPESEVPDPLAFERRRHDAYGGSRRRLYLGGARYFQALDMELAAESPRPVLVRGRSGGGKSALVANWLARWSQAHPDIAMIVHHLGCGADAADPVRLAVRIMQEISLLVGEEFKPTSDPEEQLDELAKWLATASAWAERTGRNVLIVLDGLDKLADRRHLRWFPTVLPPGVRLVASCLDGEVLKAALPRLQWRELIVESFTAAEQTQFIGEYLGRFRKQLTAEQAHMLQAHPLVSNPLFLLTVLEELRVFGVHEELDQRLATLLSPPPSKQPGEEPTVDDAFEHVLARVEADYGTEPVQRVMEALWASRAGLYTDEILAIAGVPPATWAGIVNALDESLYESSGRINFGHDYLRKAVEDRYALTGGMQLALHRRLAEYFRQREPDARVAEELPWQWREAQSQQLLRECLTDLEMFTVLYSRDEYELLGYWVWLRDDVSEAYEAEYKSHAGNSSLQRMCARNLGSFLKTAGYYRDFVVSLYRATLQDDEQRQGVDHPDTLRTMNDLASVLVEQGDLAAAEKLYLRAVETGIKSQGLNHQCTLSSLTGAAGLLQQIGDYAAADDLYRQALEGSAQSLGDGHPLTIWIAGNLAGLLSDAGKYDAAEPLLRWALAAEEEAHGSDHPSLLSTINNLALLLKRRGDYAAAESLYRRAKDSSERSVGPSHPTTLTITNNLANVLRLQGDLDASRALCQRVLGEREKSLGPDHPDTFRSAASLANLLREQGEFATAEVLYHRAKVGLEASLGPDHPATLVCVCNLAGLLSDQEDYANAAPLCVQAIQGLSQTLGTTHPTTLEIMQTLLKCHLAQQRYVDALEVARQILPGLQTTNGQDHPDTINFQKAVQELEDIVRR